MIDGCDDFGIIVALCTIWWLRFLCEGRFGRLVGWVGSKKRIILPYETLRWLLFCVHLGIILVCFHLLHFSGGIQACFSGWVFPWGGGM